MDKFGIFNLLNSFLSQNPSSSSEDTSASATESNPLGNLISGLLTPSTQKSNPTKPSEKQPTSKKPLPLQSSMLYTMNSHDEFIKRVAKNKQPIQKNKPRPF